MDVLLLRSQFVDLSGFGLLLNDLSLLLYQPRIKFLLQPLGLHNLLLKLVFFFQYGQLVSQLLLLFVQFLHAWVGIMVFRHP